MITIYALQDPRSGELRYIGQSKHPEQRFKEHLADRWDSAKTRWLRDLREAGEEPVWFELEICAPEVADEREQFNIACMRDRHRLCNQEIVGRNPAFYPREDKTDVLRNFVEGSVDGIWRMVDLQGKELDELRDRVQALEAENASLKLAA